MKKSIKLLCSKAEEVYSKYATMEGCDKEELDSLYDKASEMANTMYDMDVLNALHKLIIVKRHSISGVIVENGIKIKYTNHDSVITAEIIK